MLISLNWIRDFVDLPDSLDPAELGERFTRTTAELDAVERIQIEAKGLIVARVRQVEALPETQGLSCVVLDIGRGATLESVTAAQGLRLGANVVYAPPGAYVAKLGKIDATRVAGRNSQGMIVPAEALGITMAVQEAVFLSDANQPGEAISPDLFDDWVFEVDNKSITHRPDLWGHYGTAREIAAIVGAPLKTYPVEPLEALSRDDLPKLPITIAAPDGCRRYSGIVVTGVPTQPGPLWMQLRLGRVGMRPISALVDLTNYVMADLGQPMHAFDGNKVQSIEVNWAQEGERFKTLDGVERTLNSSTLMIQSAGRSIALAGIMGGLETEVSESTTSLFLESANFDSAAIRRAATRLGMRTDASARFEKSLDTSNTVLSIQRFLHLAKQDYRSLKLVSRLSDAFPRPFPEVAIGIKPAHVKRIIGREVQPEEMARLLGPLGFCVKLQSVKSQEDVIEVQVPAHRATGDINVEEDVIEEIARCVGYDTIESSLPCVSVRHFEPDALHELEQQTLEYFTATQRFHELHGYIWYDAEWFRQLGIDPGPCLELRNPAAEGLSLLRRSLMPGLLAAVTKNRFYFDSLALIELGSVFEPEANGRESRRVGLILARRGKKLDDELHAQIKGAIEGWVWDRYADQVVFNQAAADASYPWEHHERTATVALGDLVVGRTSVIDLALRRDIDEHLASWSMAWAEITHEVLAARSAATECLGSIPSFPLIDLDFSIVVPRTTRYGEVVNHIRSFRSELLKSARYVAYYEGESIGADRRSLTFRTVIGSDERTLADEDAASFREQLEKHLKSAGYELRR